MSGTSPSHRPPRTSPARRPASGRHIASDSAGSMPVPETRYARAGDISIAYQVIGDGPFDLVYLPGWISNVEENWSEPGYARFLRRLASFSRLIVFDKRGTGLSDRVATTPTLETRIEDLQAVMNAVGSDQAALFGASEGGSMCALFAATWPERTRALIMYGTYARRMYSTDYPWAPRRAEREAQYRAYLRDWGGSILLDGVASSVKDDERFRRWWAGYLRRSASPGAAMALSRMNSEIDIRHILPTIRVPTLVVHRRDDPFCPVEGARYIAANIPNAGLMEIPGTDHLPFVGDIDALLDPVQEFLTGAPPAVEMDRVLTTILIIDIVDSTGVAIALGDRRWRSTLERFRMTVRQELTRFRGDERNVTGDGFVATFDGPARAASCACAIVRSVCSLGIEVRAGLHTGECTLSGNDLDGIAVHIAARTMSIAAPSEVVVTSMVRDLVAGSTIAFTDHGRHTLKGIPGIWRLFAVDT